MISNDTRCEPMRAAYEADITKLLRARGPLRAPSVVTIAAHTGVSRCATYHRLIAMEAKGLVICVRSGRRNVWRLPRNESTAR